MAHVLDNASEPNCLGWLPSSDIQFIDGQALTHDSFGFTDFFTHKHLET